MASKHVHLVNRLRFTNARTVKSIEGILHDNLDRFPILRPQMENKLGKVSILRTNSFLYSTAEKYWSKAFISLIEMFQSLEKNFGLFFN